MMVFSDLTSKLVAMISPGLKTGDDAFSRFNIKTGGGGFLDLWLKTGSSV
jgi:hypothetical protein